MTHEELWRGITNVAKWMNLSCSGLAIMSGLDATTFNKSKRIGRGGHHRWPSTYSLACVLRAAGIGLGDFEKFMSASWPDTEKQ